jgi:hypothetical protein
MSREQQAPWTKESARVLSQPEEQMADRSAHVVRAQAPLSDEHGQLERLKR